MPRSEVVLTIVGLAGTFMLPWPGQPERTVESNQIVAAPQRPVCADAAGGRLVRRDAQPHGGV